LLYERSGLLGVSGISSDMRLLLTSADPHAAEAVNLFVYRIVGEIGMLAARMGGIDAIVFSAGIGENSPPIRSRICAGCTWLGARLDETANSVDLELIHTPASTIQLAIVPTDEERMIALHTKNWIGQDKGLLAEAALLCDRRDQPEQSG
jgi:acetate kinase